MTKPKMIIVEDDLKLQKMLQDYFVAQDFDVTVLTMAAMPHTPSSRSNLKSYYWI